MKSPLARWRAFFGAADGAAQPDLPLWSPIAAPEAASSPPPAASSRPPKAAEDVRHILLGQHKVPYRLRRSRRKSIGLIIDRQGLRVAAPERSRLRDIEAMLQQHAGWVLEKLGEWASRSAPTLLPLTEGAVLQLGGQPWRLRYSSTGIQVRFLQMDAADGPIILLPAQAEAAQLRAGLCRAVKRHAAHVLSARAAMLAQAHGITLPPVRLSNARTRWGSCSRLSGIRLNWRLILAPVEVADYVIAHELAHLKEMNHSPKFWAEVERLCPDHRNLRLRLRHWAAHEMPHLAAE